ncbi:Aste57867_18796 [Aphanomyces stellatus]|uniref:Aste57867_18796 protein n=1 Tax=Aphanomyces stellatus TaxID=120398 RepID=A0A485LF99_9STRA|nr:hypothetical protein As57867_018732 [Aphanomyces stellatus]VFT95530.1 Aste57867_18796 [Aphanomyces stellatus]
MAAELDVRATKAKNLLSSITALAFADKDDDDEGVTDAAYRAESAHIQQVLREHQVFRFVWNGNALNKFYNSMIQQTKDSSACRQEVAMSFLAVAVEGSAMEHLELRVSKLLDVVFHALKHQHVSVCVPALHILTHLIFNVKHAPVDVRRLLVEQLARLVPLIVTHVGAVALSVESAPFFVASFEALYVGCTSLSTTFRPFASKIEHACLVLLSPPTDVPVTVAQSVLGAMANCLGAIAHATAADAASTTWQQLVERVVLCLHYQLDILSGKDKASESRTRPASLKPWLKDMVMPSLPLFLQAERLVFKVQALSTMLAALLSSRAIAEKDIVLVAADVLTLLRRAFSVRADAVGKQSAISDDGRQLPSSVLYAALPALQPHWMTVLSALVSAGHVTIFRFASSIAKVVQLSTNTTVPAAVPALHATLQVVLASLGAGAYPTIGAPVLTWTLGQLDHLLPQRTQPAAAGAALAPVPASAGGGGTKKKRQRQQQQAVTAEPKPAAVVARSSPSVHHVHHVRVVTNAALETLAVLLGVASAWMSQVDRVAITTIVHACQQDVSLDATVVTKVSLANVVAPDAHGTRGLALPQTMAFWARRTSGSWRGVALNVGESVLHPRAPPMALGTASAAAAGDEGKRPASTTASHVASAQRAKRLEAELDWDKAEDDDEDDDEEPTKKQKVDEDEEEEEEDMDDEKAVVDEEVEEAEEEGGDDNVEGDVAGDDEDMAVEDMADNDQDESTNPMTADAAIEDDGDDFEFPDIVVDDDDE